MIAIASRRPHLARRASPIVADAQTKPTTAINAIAHPRCAPKAACASGFTRQSASSGVPGIASSTIVRRHMHVPKAKKATKKIAVGVGPLS